MSNEVSTTSSAVPAHLQATGNSGFVENDSLLLSAPRTKLVQKSSNEFDEGIPGGEFYSTVTGKHSTEIIVTPIKGHVEYAKFDDAGNLTFKSDSEDEAKAELGEDYWKARRLNVILATYNEPMPTMFSFSGASYKAGQKLYQLAKVANSGCMFSKAYKLTRTEHEGAGGKYWVASVVVAKDVEGYSDDQGWLTEDAFNVVKEIAEQV